MISSTQSAAATVLSVGIGRLRTAIEATRTQKPLAVRIFSRGQRLILNLFRPLKASGSPSFRSLVHDANQPTRGFFHGLKFSPIPSVAAAHESNIAKGSCHGRQVACKG